MRVTVVSCDSCGARLTGQDDVYVVRLSGLAVELGTRAEVCSLRCAADWVLRLHEREAAAALAEVS